VTLTPGSTVNFPGNWCSQRTYFAPIRQIWSRSTCCRVSDRNTFQKKKSASTRVQLKKKAVDSQDLGI
jgi:hypothetical protein